MRLSNRARLRRKLRGRRASAENRCQVVLMSKHSENDTIDDWIEAMYDWDSWK